MLGRIPSPPNRSRAETSPENAAFSTGPTTPEGKAICAQNAFRHGFRSAKPLLPGEDPAPYLAFAAELHEDFAPADRLERRMVDRLCVLLWRRERGVRIDSDLFATALANQSATNDTCPTAEQPSLAHAFTTHNKEFSLLLRYTNQDNREIERLTKALRDCQRERRATEALAAAAIALAPPAAPVRTHPQPPTANAANAANAADAAVDWAAVVQELYFAVAAGPQGPHPLRETYYGAYAIWLKHSLMVEHDIGDDEAGSHLTALQVAFAMRLAGVRPVPGQVWGAPDALADWRKQTAANAREHASVDPGASAGLGSRPHPNAPLSIDDRWRALITRDYARRDGTVEDAARKIADLPPDADVDSVAGPWQTNGNLADKDRALALAAGIREARSKALQP